METPPAPRYQPIELHGDGPTASEIVISDRRHDRFSAMGQPDESALKAEEALSASRFNPSQFGVSLFPQPSPEIGANSPACSGAQRIHGFQGRMPGTYQPRPKA